MELIMSDNLAKEALNELKLQMKKVGASDYQVESQISKLQDVIVVKTIANLCAQLPPPQKLAGDDELAEYINSNFKKSDIKTILVATTQDVLDKYLSALGLS